MEQQDLQMLQERIKQLERWRKISILILTLVTIALLLLALGLILPARAIKTRSLVITDNKGNPLIELGVNMELLVATKSENKGKFPVRPVVAPFLKMRNAEGKERISLSVASNGTPEFILRDTADKVRIGVSVLSYDGTPTVTLYDGAGKGRAMLGLLPDESPTLTLYDDAWQTVFKAP